MQIESLRIRNFRVFNDVRIENIPQMAVFMGQNGAGKTTFFDVFGFLHDCLNNNVRSALAKRGGFSEVISRGQEDDMQFEVKFRPSPEEPVITYELTISLNEKHTPVVKKEVMRFRRGQHGAPWKILDFAFGEGVAAEGDLRSYEDVQIATRTPQRVSSPDILAVKGLGQFENFPAIASLRRLIEDWYVSDFHIESARTRQEANYSETLSTTGDNLAQVAKFLYDNHRERFDEILNAMRERVPGVTNVEAKVTEDGYVILRFQDDHFKNPFSSKFVSDGTIKMFTYLVLLSDPNPHALLCVEEPENQLYPELLPQLAEEFRHYSNIGGQVFISTHSPDFLNAIHLDELYCLVKSAGYTKIVRASDLPLVVSLCQEGDLLGSLWSQGILLAEASKAGGAGGMKLIFLLEEPSMKYLLDELLPRILPPDVTFQTIPHHGKRDLERSIPRKLRGWKEPGDIRFVILHDQDTKDCVSLKQELLQLCAVTDRPCLVRIACQEMEAWYIGDIDALCAAYDRPKLREVIGKKKFRVPDAIPDPKEELYRLIPEHQQISGAKRVAPHMDIERNTSASFQQFVRGVRRLACQ